MSSLERHLHPTLDLVVASYIENRRSASHDSVGLPSQISGVDDALMKSIWKDYFINLDSVIEYLMDLRKNDVSTILQHPSNVSKAVMDDLVAHAIYQTPVGIMDMHDVIGSIAIVCTSNVTVTEKTRKLLNDLYSTEEKREEVRSKVMRGYMTDIFVFLLAMSEGTVSKGLHEFRQSVRSLPEEIEKLSVSQKAARLPPSELKTLREIGYVILESLENRHCGHIGAYMDEIEASVTPAQLRAIYIRDFNNGPPPPLDSAGNCFDGLFTLWFWNKCKFEYLVEWIRKKSD